ncbi:MAG: hypothetical protein MUF72_21300 [Elainella sp. Prado103]|jgi:hypothetical protein|nr:hypothetical protein [Elainella sp. Prado103]
MADTAPFHPISPSDSLELAPRLGSFLEEYSEIATILPVLAGLFVTSRLQLRGAQALLINLLIAAVTRQIVLQLKQQAHSTMGAIAANEQSSNRSRKSPGAATGGSANQSTHDDSASSEDYTIVHSTPGRLRLRIPRLSHDEAYAKRLEKLLTAELRVLKVRLNRAAASLVVLYDGMGVSELELGMRLLQILEQAESETPSTVSHL